MTNENEARDSGHLAGLSLYRLGAYAMEEELIGGIEIEEDRVIIRQGDNRFVLPPKQASTFLIGMLRGRSWFVESDRPFIARAKTSLSPSRERHPERPLEATLDSLLAFTRDAGILEGFEKDIEARTVRIDIPACSTTLSYTDALGYLLDCIQDEMRTLRGGR